MLRRVKILDYLLVVCTKLAFNPQYATSTINQGETMPVKTKEKPVKTTVVPKKWELNHNDYLELLESIDKNAKVILELSNDVKRLKIRIGL
mgnify:CR=1 FL=1